MWAKGLSSCVEKILKCECISHHSDYTVCADLAQFHAHNGLFLLIYRMQSLLHSTLCLFPHLASLFVAFDFIILLLNTVGWWVFGLVIGATPEWRYLMEQKATVSRLWDLLVLAAAIDFSSKLSPCFLIGLCCNSCQASKMSVFAWAQSNIKLQVCNIQFQTTCPCTDYEAENHRTFVSCLFKVILCCFVVVLRLMFASLWLFPIVL